MFKSIKRLAQASKDMMLAMTVDDIQFSRKHTDKEQYLIFSYIRGDLVDYTEEYKIDGNKISIGETFQKKTTLWFKNNVVQEKFITI